MGPRKNVKQYLDQFRKRDNGRKEHAISTKNVPSLRAKKMGIRKTEVGGRFGGGGWEKTQNVGNLSFVQKKSVHRSPH